ncbi:MAG: riboflavin synthase [Candidatus Omnitrophota bacterium]
MFTGIIKEVVKITTLTKKSALTVIGVNSKLIFPQAEISDSIAVNGTCLTLSRKSKGELFFDAIAPTIKVTNLKYLKRGDYVNLEPALELKEKVGGHFVLGHVDAELKLRRSIARGNYWQLEIELPARFRTKVVVNGSIAVEGVSLTVKKISGVVFTVDIIPFTYKNTTLQYKRPGARLNVEFDYLLSNKGISA